MPRTRKRPVRQPSLALLWGRWALALGLLVGLTAGLLAFARYQSPEARWHRQHEAQAGQTRRSAPTEDLVDWRPIHGQLVQYSRRSYPVIVGQEEPGTVTYYSYMFSGFSRRTTPQAT